MNQPATTHYIAESVTKYHPDKICDGIADAIVDACLEQDKHSRVAVDAIGGHGVMMLMGEVTSQARLDFSQVAQEKYQQLTGQDIKVLANITQQSPEIAQKVNLGGAGDQGLMIGYACNENEQHLPQEMHLARRLLEGFEVDGKSQVVMQDKEVVNVVLSVQGKSQRELEQHVLLVLPHPPCEMYCNNIGKFEVGGFESDSGCTGRKIVVDAYGGRVPVGGGAFSGKDPTKVDRSGAYMARWIALQLLKKYGAREVLVKLGYVIGRAEPLLQTAVINGKEEELQGYDCRPAAIIEQFDLLRPIYNDLAENGHFGRKELAWEKV